MFGGVFVSRIRANAHIGYSPLTFLPRPVLSPRKIPRQARATATFEAIVEAAARILEDAGLAGYTTNAIAARAGVSIGSLYQYFPDRDAITRSLIERQTAALISDARESLACDTGREGLQALIWTAVRHQLRRPALSRLLDFEEERLPLSEEVRAVGERLAEIVTHCLGRDDLVELSEPHHSAHDLLAIIKGMVDSAGKRREDDQECVSQRVERAVFGYLGAPPSK